MQLSADVETRENVKKCSKRKYFIIIVAVGCCARQYGPLCEALCLTIVDEPRTRFVKKIVFTGPWFGKELATSCKLLQFELCIKARPVPKLIIRKLNSKCHFQETLSFIDTNGNCSTQLWIHWHRTVVNCRVKFCYVMKICNYIKVLPLKCPAGIDELLSLQCVLVSS